MPSSGGRHGRVALRDSISNKVCNNFSMKLPGLAPTACGRDLGNGSSRLYKTRAGHITYNLTSNCSYINTVANRNKVIQQQSQWIY